MKVLLVSTNTMREPYPTYPIGLDYVLNAISPPHRVRCVDMNELKTASALADVLSGFRPDVVGVSIRNIDNVDGVCTQTFIGEVAGLIEVIRSNSEGVIVLGGSGFTILPGELMTELDADFGVIGEGERLPLLLDALERGESGAGLPGIVAGKGPAGYPEPISVPFGRGIFPHHSYTSYYLKRGGMLNLQTKRGCPFGCIYCTYPHIEGRRFRFTPPSEVGQMARMLQDGGAKYLYITDSTFNGSYEHSREVARAFQKAGVSIPWGGFFTPTRPPPDYYRVLADAGLRHVEFGTEALSDLVLGLYHKSFVKEEVFLAHRSALDAGLHVAHYLMFGGPGEDEDTIRETLSNSCQLEKTVFFVYNGVRIYPHTALHERAVREGQLDPAANLLYPVFYWSPALSRARGTALINELVAGRPNWVVGGGQPGMFKALSRLHARGQVGPLWEHLVR
ncbi:MAG: lipid biosynthesis B12-binding/radical SAM protein [Syntrophales bacterium]|jgi:radical SAM superfamily enzyme YgiQ (UPF0313 family)|nr:radical SAM protein [Syntrophobacterales bacterium]